MKKRCCVYVIRLDSAVWEKSGAFRRESPGRDPRKPCVYVGKSGLPPEQRLKNHKDGQKAGRFVERYGLALLPRLYERIPLMTHEDALVMEKMLAKRLRRRGCAVWQH